MHDEFLYRKKSVNIRENCYQQMNFIGQNRREGEVSYTTARKRDHQSRDINVQCAERSIKLGLLAAVQVRHRFTKAFGTRIRK